MVVSMRDLKLKRAQSAEAEELKRLTETIREQRAKAATPPAAAALKRSPTAPPAVEPEPKRQKTEQKKPKKPKKKALGAIEPLPLLTKSAYAKLATAFCDHHKLKASDLESTELLESSELWRTKVAWVRLNRTFADHIPAVQYCSDWNRLVLDWAGLCKPRKVLIDHKQPLVFKASIFATLSHYLDTVPCIKPWCDRLLSMLSDQDCVALAQCRNVDRVWCQPARQRLQAKWSRFSTYANSIFTPLVASHQVAAALKALTPASATTEVLKTCFAAMGDGLARREFVQHWKPPASLYARFLLVNGSNELLDRCALVLREWMGYVHAHRKPHRLVCYHLPAQITASMLGLITQTLHPTSLPAAKPDGSITNGLAYYAWLGDQRVSKTDLAALGVEALCMERRNGEPVVYWRNASTQYALLPARGSMMVVRYSAAAAPNDGPLMRLLTTTPVMDKHANAWLQIIGPPKSGKGVAATEAGLLGVACEHLQLKLK